MRTHFLDLMVPTIEAMCLYLVNVVQKEEYYDELQSLKEQEALLKKLVDQQKQVHVCSNVLLCTPYNG